MIIVAAAWISGTFHATIGLLPPSSSANILFGVSANWWCSDMPAPTDPVKRSPSIPACPANALPSAGPPISSRSTPSGTPASWKHLTRNSPVAGVFSDGLKTTALPASSAGTMWPLGRCAGKLYGPSTASTPCGLWRSARRGVIGAGRAGAFGIGGDRDVDLGDHRLDLGAGFPDRLAGLAGDEIGEGVGFLP